MNITHILNNISKPAPYTPGTSLMWVDEYISTQLLQVHLNQHTDLASRRDGTIDQTVRWILGQVDGSELDILDLGCGPGLYTEKLARQGHHVTGVDFSANSINHARESAKKNNLNIHYRRLDYLSLAEENQYDLIIMIFTDFGVLSPEERICLLANVHRALKPGGTFIFDVLNKNAPAVHDKKDWEIKDCGFWRPGPYMAMSESLYYENEDVTLHQHLVIDAARHDIYRFWVHRFSNGDLESILTNAGFHTVNCYSDIIPESELYSSDSVTFCSARK